MTILFCCVIAYIAGSIPSAFIAGKVAKGIDLRQEGSGNLGFTNAWRVLGPAWSIPVLLFDIGKGVFVVWLAYRIFPGNDWVAILSGLLAILGHNWTIFLGFRGGGKGVATSAGVFLALAPYALLVALFFFLVVLFTTQYMSLASLTGAVLLVASEILFHYLYPSIAPSPEILAFSSLAALLVIIRHISNIKRLLAGTENKLGQHEKDE